MPMLMLMLMLMLMFTFTIMNHSHSSNGRIERCVEESPSGHIQQILTLSSYPNEPLALGCWNVVPKKNPTRSTWGLPSSQHSTHPPNINEHSQGRENSKWKSMWDVLFDSMHMKHDRISRSRLHWEDDPRTPWPAVMKHDHSVLRPQTTSWMTTDDGENFYYWEPAPAVSRCWHS